MSMLDKHGAELQPRPLTLAESHALQRQFAAHIRHPARNPAPAGIADERLQAYRTLFFSSVTGFLDDTFKHLSLLLGEQWRPLNRQFYADYVAQSPYFHRISAEFLQYLESLDTFSPALLALARYEQRLFDCQMFSLQDGLADTDQLVASDDTNLLHTPLMVRTGVYLESFEYNLPALLAAKHWSEALGCQTAPVFMAFYRDASLKVKTLVLSPLAMALLELLQTPRSLQEALDSLAVMAQMPVAGLSEFALQFTRQAIGKTLVAVCNLSQPLT